MEDYGLGQYKDINSFVEAKLRRLDAAEAGFASLFELMFSEKENLMFEKSEGYRILQTTYGEAHGTILRLAATLKQTLALPEGAAVGLSMENSLLWIELFWAILLCGWRPLLMNLRLSDAVLEQAIADCGVQAVLSDGRQYSVRTVAADSVVPADGNAPLSSGTTRDTSSSFAFCRFIMCSASLPCTSGSRSSRAPLCSSTTWRRRPL